MFVSQLEEELLRGIPGSGIVFLLTDFGVQDAYVGILKAVLLSVNPRLSIHDLCHEVPPQDLQRAAWILAQASPYLPRAAVCLVVVDPGVGSTRRPIVVKSGSRLFVGPDNGVLGFLCSQDRDCRVWQLEPERIVTRPLSRTFHGRDLFAPVAALLASGIAPERLGASISDPVILAETRPTEVSGGLLGEVAYVDGYGNLISNLRLPPAEADRKGLTAVIEGRRLCVSQTYSAVERGELVALEGSHGFLELAVNGGSAFQLLQAGRGTPVTLEPAFLSENGSG
jgi:S-adenosylmethionine hydrolase